MPRCCENSYLEQNGHIQLLAFVDALVARRICPTTAGGVRGRSANVWGDRQFLEAPLSESFKGFHKKGFNLGEEFVFSKLGRY